MKLRTPEDLDQALDNAFAWRKKELLLLKGGLASPKRTDTATRAAVALTYAHLEGFFKQGASLFLQFLASQTTRLADLQLPHQARAIALAVRLRHSGSPPTDATQLLMDALLLLESQSQFSAKLPFKAEVSTYSNLNSQVLRSLLRQTGLDPDLFSLKSKQLDEGLLHSRNHIAHGQYLEVSPEEVQQWGEMVLDMCQVFRDALGNAAATGAWRRPRATDAA